MASGCDATRGAKLHTCIHSGGVGRDDFGKLLPFSNEGSADAVSIETSAACKYGVKGYGTALRRLTPSSFIRYHRKEGLRMKSFTSVAEALIPEYEVLVSQLLWVQPASYSRRPYCAQRTRRKLTIREYLHVTESHVVELCGKNVDESQPIESAI